MIAQDSVTSGLSLGYWTESRVCNQRKLDSTSQLQHLLAV